jgi:photosystem II stability/assembly factor-like uncharacterized protein
MKIFNILILIFFSLTIKIYSQQHWLTYSHPTTQNLWKCHFVDTTYGWAVGDSGTIIYTSNGGLNWVQQNSHLREYMVSVNFINKRLGWAIAWGLDTNFFGTYVLKTTNGGITWDTARYPINDTFVRAIYFLDSLTGFMGGGPATLLKTTNAGITWNPCEVDTSSIISKFPISRFRFYTHNYGFAMGGIMDIAGVIWKTTNCGLYWNVYAIAPEPVNDIVFFDSLNLISVAGDYEYGASILKSSNAGLNWSYKNMGIFGVPNCLSFRTVGEGWAAMGYLPQFLVTLDTGMSFNLTDTPDSACVFDLQFINNKFGIGVGLNGVVVKFDYSTVNITNSTSVPYKNELRQNYPNPFNPYTTIEYSVTGISDVEIKVYNLLGQEIRTLFKGVKNEGKYSLKFAGNGLASGIYYYRLSTKNLKSGETYITTKKMILLK